MDLQELVRLLNTSGWFLGLASGTVGLFIVIGAFLMLGKFGSRKPGQTGDIKGTTTAFLAGIGLIYLGATLTVWQNTAYVADKSYTEAGGHNPLSWETDHAVDEASAAVLVVKLLMLLGTFAFIMFWLSIKQMNANDRPENGTIKKVFWFGIGGAVLIDPIQSAESVGTIVPFIGEWASSMKEQVQ